MGLTDTTKGKIFRRRFFHGYGQFVIATEYVGHIGVFFLVFDDGSREAYEDFREDQTTEENIWTMNNYKMIHEINLNKK